MRDHNYDWKVIIRGRITYLQKEYNPPKIQSESATSLLPVRNATLLDETNMPPPIILLMIRQATSSVFRGFWFLKRSTGG